VLDSRGVRVEVGGAKAGTLSGVTPTGGIPEGWVARAGGGFAFRTAFRFGATFFFGATFRFGATFFFGATFLAIAFDARVRFAAAFFGFAGGFCLGARTAGAFFTERLLPARVFAIGAELYHGRPA
jgi:hypothetical protein